MKKIITNKIKCNSCEDIIESESRHDFKWCSCDSVAVDGGKDYLKRTGTDFEELSVLKIDDYTVKCLDCDQKVSTYSLIETFDSDMDGSWAKYCRICSNKLFSYGKKLNN